MTTDTDPDDDMLAAEHAMGLLQGEALRLATARMADDRDFRRRVEEWERLLAGMAEDLAPVAPPSRTKAATMARLFPEAQTQARSRGLSWLWGAAGLAAIVLVAGLAWFNLAGMYRTGGPPLYVAEIATPDGDFRVVALLDKAADQITLTRTAGAAPPGRILQVWAHGEGEPAVSVGLWPEGETVRLSLPADIAAVEGILTIGVSEEPPGGSPTGSPTGRVFGTVDIPGVRARG